VAKRRHAGRRAAGRSTTGRSTTGRRAATDRTATNDDDLAPVPAVPSVREVAVYVSLAVVVAVIVLTVNGRPWWHAAVVVVGAVVALAALAMFSGRTGTQRKAGRARRRGGRA